MREAETAVVEEDLVGRQCRRPEQPREQRHGSEQAALEYRDTRDRQAEAHTQRLDPVCHVGPLREHDQLAALAETLDDDRLRVDAARVREKCTTCE